MGNIRICDVLEKKAIIILQSVIHNHNLNLIKGKLNTIEIF